MSRILRVWNRFWFEDSDPYNPLGILRIVLVTVFTYKRFFEYLNHMATRQGLPQDYFATSPVLSLLHVPYPLPDKFFLTFAIALGVFAALSLLGVFTRISLALYTACMWYLACGDAADDFFNHEAVLSLHILLILVIAPGTEAWSLDRLWRWYKLKSAKLNPPAVLDFQRQTLGSNWGYKLVLVLMAFIYMNAGISKLRYSDGAWLRGETLAYHMSRADGEQDYLGAENPEQHPLSWKDSVVLEDYNYGYNPSHPWAKRLAAIPALMIAISCATVFFELCGFMLLLPSRWRNLYIIGALLMHTATGFSMGIRFNSYRAVLLVLFDWRSLGARLWKRALPG